MRSYLSIRLDLELFGDTKEKSRLPPPADDEASLRSFFVPIRANAHCSGMVSLQSEIHFSTLRKLFLSERSRHKMTPWQFLRCALIILESSLVSNMCSFTWTFPPLAFLTSIVFYTIYRFSSFWGPCISQYVCTIVDFPTPSSPITRSFNLFPTRLFLGVNKLFII